MSGGRTLPARLWLLRHGAVQVPPGVCYGRSDVLPDPAALHLAAQYAARRLPVGVVVRSSPLRRCAELAAALHALRPDLRWQTDERLMELDFGGWEGRSWNAIAPAAFDTWMAGFADTPPGGDGEPLRTFMARVGAAWDEWHARNANEAWITHAGVIRACELLKHGIRLVEQPTQWPQSVIGQGDMRVMWRRLPAPAQQGPAHAAS